MSALWQDLRYAARALGKNPGFTLVAVAILALGVGANTAVFGWVRELVLSPLPGVVQADRMVAIETRTPAGTRIDSSYADYVDLAEGATSFSGIVAFQERHVNLGEKDASRRLYALFVSGNYFEVLGVRPQLGRAFVPDEVRIPGGHPVAVIGHGFWGSHFGFDPQVVGKTLRLNDQDLTVVGVTPPQFKGTLNGLNFEVYVPLAAAGRLGGEVGGDRARLAGNRTNRWLAMMGRLRPGTSPRQAQTEAAVLAARLARTFPDSNRGLGFVVEPIWKATYGASSRFAAVFLALFAAVGLVLLIACTNVANLLLVRATGRRREIAVRLALGATRRRLVQQLVTESVLLACAGGVAGFLLVPYVNRLLAGLAPAGIPLPIDLVPALDARLFGFGLAVSLLAGVLAGLVPALQASRPNVAEGLGDGTAGGGTSPRRQRLRRGLVVTQIALALVLLTTTGLFLASLRNANRIDPGFDRSNVLLVGFDFPASIDRTHARPFYTQLLRRVAAIPGVVAASYGNHTPLWLEGGDWEDVRVDGYTPGPDESMKIDVTLTWPRYFSVMRMPLLAGRDFDEQDDAQSGRVAIVNQAFAARYLGGAQAVGSRIWILDHETTVVGVARTAKYRSLTEAPRPFVYLPQLQTLPSGTALHVRVAPATDLGTTLAAIRGEVRAIDPRVATVGASLAEATEAAVLPQTVGARLLGALGMLALLIASIGVYGLMAYSVTQRRREIGVRVALGASPADVRGIFLREATRTAALGLGAGLAASLAATRLLASLLVDVRPDDPIVFAAVLAALGACALAASWIPARRAAGIDPMEALRCD